MKSQVRVRRGLVATGIALGGLGGVGGGITASASATNAVPSIVTCQGKFVVRPTTFVTACGDGNAYFQKMVWTSWTGTKATATATLVMNNCTPYCAAGKFISYRATVQLTRPKVVAKHLVFLNLHASYVVKNRTLSYSFALIG